VGIIYVGLDMDEPGGRTDGRSAKASIICQVEGIATIDRMRERPSETANDKFLFLSFFEFFFFLSFFEMDE